MKLGNITVEPIVELAKPFLPPQQAMPEATPEAMASYVDWLQPWSLCPETGRFILKVQSWLVRTAHHVVLIDTCVGCNKEAPQYPHWHQRSDQVWLQRLAAAGVQPEEVDYILCTHLHLDHVGWNTQLRDGRFVPTFPNAKYIFSKADVAIAEEANSIPFQQSVLPVLEAGQVQQVDGAFNLDDTVWLEPTPGHTPGHVAVGIESAGETAVMCGDLIHFPVQCHHPEWTMLFDSDPVKGAETRRNFLQDNCDSGRLVLTAHFPKSSMGYFEQKGDAFSFRFKEA